MNRRGVTDLTEGQMMTEHEEPHKLVACSACRGDGSVNRVYDDRGHLQSWEACPSCGGGGFVRAPLTSQ